MRLRYMKNVMPLLNAIRFSAIGDPKLLEPLSFRDAETTILIKFCVLEGVGEGTFYGKLPPNAVFLGKSHDNKIWKFCEFYCQKFCCHLGGS